MDRKKVWLAVVIGLGIALWPLASASAHVTITPSTTSAGASATLEVSFDHGCDGAATTGLTIQVPEELRSVSARPAKGWKVDADPRSITYRAEEPVPDGQRAVFELTVVLPEGHGVTLTFPTVQTCTGTEVAWIEVPPDGQVADDLEFPAPAFTIGETGEPHVDAEPAARAAADGAGEQGRAFAVLASGVLGVGLVTAVLLRRRRQ